jgi:large subunit ribosomal protein L34
MKKGVVRKSNLKKKRCHGFLKRMSSPNGRKALKRRRQKGRRILIAF